MTRYFAALTPTREKPVITEPTFDELMARVEGVIVKPPLGMQAFWGTKGVWGAPGPHHGSPPRRPGPRLQAMTRAWRRTSSPYNHCSGAR